MPGPVFSVVSVGFGGFPFTSDASTSSATPSPGTVPGPDPEPILELSISGNSFVELGATLTLECVTNRVGTAVEFFADGDSIGTATMDGLVGTLSYQPHEVGNYTITATALQGSDSTSSSPIVVTADITVTLGEFTATGSAGNMVNQACGFNQNKLTSVYDRSVGKRRQSVAYITQGYLGARAVRDMDSSTWTTHVGLFAPHAADNDEHYAVTQIMFPSGWKLFQGMGHVDARNWCLIPPGQEAPGTAVRTPAVAGATNETSMTYPEHLPLNWDGSIVLERFRDGASGDADTVLNLWLDVGAPGNELGLTPICVALKAPFVSDSTRSAYFGAMALHSTNGKIGIIGNWRDTDTATTANRVWGTFSPDMGQTWYQDPECTVPQTIPITYANCAVIKNTVPQQGLWDLAGGCWGAGESEFYVNYQSCTGPGAPHGTADSPHDSEYRFSVRQGGGWVEYNVHGLEEDIGSHYTSVTSGKIRAVGTSVAYNGQVHLLTGNVLPEFTNYQRHSTADFLNWERQRLSSASGGYCVATLDYPLLQHKSNLLSSIAVSTISVGTPNAAVNLNVFTTDMSAWVAPTDDGSLWEMVEGQGVGVVCAHQADRVVSAGTGLISRLVDLTGKERHYDFATPANHFASGGPNNRAYIRGNGTSIYGVNSIDLAAPGTRAIYRFTILRLFNWVSGRAVLSGGGTGVVEILTTGTSAQVAMRNNTLTSLVDLGSGWVLTTELYTNSTADEFRVGVGSSITGTNTGPSNPSSLSMMGRSNGTVFSDLGIAEQFVCIGGKPSNEGAILTAAAAKYAF